LLYGKYLSLMTPIPITHPWLLDTIAVKLRLTNLELIITIQSQRYSKIGTMQSQRLVRLGL
jgi:hypothetical protein